MFGAAALKRLSRGCARPPECRPAVVGRDRSDLIVSGCLPGAPIDGINSGTGSRDHAGELQFIPDEAKSPFQDLVRDYRAFAA